MTTTKQDAAINAYWAAASASDNYEKALAAHAPRAYLDTLYAALVNANADRDRKALAAAD